MTTINDIRMKYWDKKFPECRTRLEEIFGPEHPTPHEVAEWKNKWRFDAIAKNCYVDLPTEAMGQTLFEITHSLGIHPYFWDTAVVPSASRYVGRNIVLFYFEEHQVLFKLGWDLV